MTLQKSKLFVKNYRLINLLFAGIFGMVFLYSGIFSAQKNNHPIPSACIVKPCASTGLSRGFSEIMRLNFTSAKKYNYNSIPIFLFFLIQFFLRLFLSKILTQKNAIILLITDLLFSTTLYIYCFSGLIFPN
jgi:hypothetical protein